MGHTTAQSFRAHRPDPTDIVVDSVLCVNLSSPPSETPTTRQTGGIALRQAEGHVFPPRATARAQPAIAAVHISFREHAPRSGAAPPSGLSTTFSAAAARDVVVLIPATGAL